MYGLEQNLFTSCIALAPGSSPAITDCTRGLKGICRILASSPLTSATLSSSLTALFWQQFAHHPTSKLKYVARISGSKRTAPASGCWAMNGIHVEPIDGRASLIGRQAASLAPFLCCGRFNSIPSAACPIEVHPPNSSCGGGRRAYPIDETF